MKFLNNPFEIIVQAVKELYGDIEVEIQFDDRIKFFKLGPIRFGHCGETIFSYDNTEPPLISISTHIPFWAMGEILAHELAHVVAGTEAGHGPEWRKVFANIHAKTREIYERKQPI